MKREVERALRDKWMCSYICLQPAPVDGSVEGFVE